MPRHIDALLAKAWVSPPHTHARTQRLMTCTRTHELARTNAHGLAACSGGCCTASRGSMAMCGSSGFHPTSGCSLPRRTARRFALSTLDAGTAVLTSAAVVEIAALRKYPMEAFGTSCAQNGLCAHGQQRRSAANHVQVGVWDMQDGSLVMWIKSDLQVSTHVSTKSTHRKRTALSARARRGRGLCAPHWSATLVPSLSYATPIVCAGTCTTWRAGGGGGECSGR